MHWSTKVILFILSGCFLISCENEKVIDEPKKSDNDHLIDSILKLSLNWNDSTLIHMDQLGSKIKQPLIYYSSNEEINYNGISISTQSKKQLQELIDIKSIENVECSEFNEYEVCLKELNDGSQLRLSLKPHPTRKWVFTLERIN